VTPPTLLADLELERPGFVLSVRLRISPGEVVAVLGPNGAGKSTVLGLLAGLLRPDRGYVELNGRVLTDTVAGRHVPPHGRGIGLLAQEPLLFPHLTVRSNVAFGPRCIGSRRRAAHAAAEHWLSEVDAVALADRHPAQLSGGQAQRIALARALAVQPQLLLLDEPLAALDVDAAPALRGLLRRVLRDGSGRRGALLVTHDPLDALTLADRVLVLGEGAVVEQGPTRQVLGTPRSAFAARIAGLDLVSGVACAQGLRTTDGTVLAGTVPAGHPVDVAEGEPVVAVFTPAAVAVHRIRPHGSPRNAFPVRVVGLEPRGDLVRLRAAAMEGGPPWVDGLVADVTPAAVADLGLEPGMPAWFAVKAAEIAIHPAPAPVPRGGVTGAAAT
jgi:molybdate transport system ATP-binding protein